MLLSSFRRTKVNSTLLLDNLAGGANTDIAGSSTKSADGADINSLDNSNKEGPNSPPKQRVSPVPSPTRSTSVPFKDSNATGVSDASGGTFVTQKPFGGSNKSQESAQQSAQQEITSPGATPAAPYPMALRSGHSNIPYIHR